MSGSLVTRQPGDRAGQATLNFASSHDVPWKCVGASKFFIAIVIRPRPDLRYQALIGCSAFCGFFAHLLNRAIGGGEVHLPFPDPACDGDPQRNPAPADRSADDARGRRGRSACAGTSEHRRVAGNPHGGFIVAAYSAAAGDLSRELGFCRTKVGRARLEFSPLSLPANSATPPL